MKNIFLFLATFVLQPALALDVSRCNSVIANSGASAGLVTLNEDGSEKYNAKNGSFKKEDGLHIYEADSFVGNAQIKVYLEDKKNEDNISP